MRDAYPVALLVACVLLGTALAKLTPGADVELAAATRRPTAEATPTRAHTEETRGATTAPAAEEEAK